MVALKFDCRLSHPLFFFLFHHYYYIFISNVSYTLLALLVPML